MTTVSTSNAESRSPRALVAARSWRYALRRLPPVLTAPWYFWVTGSTILIIWLLLTVPPHFVAPAFVTAGAAVAIAVTVHLQSRRQDRIETATDLHKEFYSKEFAKSRRDAARFIRRNRDVDGSVVDPYNLGEDDDLLEGYSELVRFYHRLAVLYLQRRVDEGLAAELFARELGIWWARVFGPMMVRSNWWTRPLIHRFTRELDRRGGHVLLVRGYREGLREPTRPERAGSRASGGYGRRLGRAWRALKDGDGNS